MWWTVLLGVGPARGEVIDRVVAVVEDQPLLASEVRVEAVLDREPSPVPGWSAMHTDPLDQLVDETIVRLVASDVSLYQPTREQVADRIAAFRSTFPDEASFRRFEAEIGVDDEHLATLLRRHMIVEKFLLRNLLSPPSDAAGWDAECRQLLASIRPRVRVRVVEPRAAEP